MADRFTTFINDRAFQLFVFKYEGLSCGYIWESKLYVMAYRKGHRVAVKKRLREPTVAQQKEMERSMRAEVAEQFK